MLCTTTLLTLVMHLNKVHLQLRWRKVDDERDPMVVAARIQIATCLDSIARDAAPVQGELKSWLDRLVYKIQNIKSINSHPAHHGAQALRRWEVMCPNRSPPASVTSTRRLSWSASSKAALCCGPLAFGWRASLLQTCLLQISIDFKEGFYKLTAPYTSAPLAGVSHPALAARPWSSRSACASPALCWQEHRASGSRCQSAPLYVEPKI